MRTTIYIDDKLLKEVKRLALETNRSLTTLIEDSLREVLTKNQKKGDNKPLKLTTFKGNGINAGVDLDDSSSLLDIMEQRNVTI